MASGHVNRINRPNTWLLRPDLRREESPCQHGAVHTWHRSADFRGAIIPSAFWGRADAPPAFCSCVLVTQLRLCLSRHWRVAAVAQKALFIHEANL
jgi:hypothetical protein